MNTRLNAIVLGALFFLGASSANAAIYDVQFTSSAGNLDFSSPAANLNPIADGLFATLQFDTTTNVFTLNTLDLDTYFGFNAVINSVYLTNPLNATITPTGVTANAGNAPTGMVRFNLLSELQDNSSVNFTLAGIDLTQNLSATSFALAAVNRVPNPDQSVFVLGQSVAAVPEPETYAMFLAGLGLLGFASRKRNV